MIENELPKSILDNPLLSSWIGFEVPGRVRVSTGKVELGQGILTALAQIAAEELDVDVGRIDIAGGVTRDGPSEGFTSGSNSTSASGAAIRLVAAEVRALVLARAAVAAGRPEGDLAIDDGRILAGGKDTGADYWSLSPEVDLARPATGSAPTKRPSDYRVVGRPVRRIDLRERLTGAPFVHDLAPDGLLHARVLHRPWRGAKLDALDERAVRRGGGVDLVIHREGDAVAFVSADQSVVIRAAEAARAAAVWIGGEPPPDDADTPGRLRALPSRVRTIERGTAAATAAAARFSSVYARGNLTHGSIAPSCAVADFDGRTLTVRTHSQGVFVLRGWLARTLGLEPEAIEVVHTPGAGCYGHNSADDAAFEAAWLALRFPGRPIRVMWTREDEFAAAPVGPAGVARLSASVDAAGRPLDWTLELWSPVHGRRPGMNGHHGFATLEAIGSEPPEPRDLADIPDDIGGGATRNALADYDLPHQTVVHAIVDDLPVRASTLRGLGTHLNIFAIESFVDELAEAAGADPVDYRLSLLSDRRAVKVVETVAELAGWRGRSRDPGSGHGYGIGFGRYKNRAAWMAAVAEVEVAEEVRVLRIWAAVDAGLVVNPDGAANQIEGGILQATSWTLMEALRFRDGRAAAETWTDYPVLRFSDVPEVVVRFTGSAEDPTLGIGEASVGPTAAAIGNAVAEALGARIRTMPLTRERIMATLLGEDG